MFSILYSFFNCAILMKSTSLRGNCNCSWKAEVHLSLQIKDMSLFVQTVELYEWPQRTYFGLSNQVTGKTNHTVDNISIIIVFAVENFDIHVKVMNVRYFPSKMSFPEL